MRMFLAALLLSLATPAVAAEGDTISGPFTAADGDTLVTAAGKRLRLAAVSAPEMDTKDGWRARGALDDLLAAAPVTCTDTGQRSYKRPVVICETADGEDLGAALIGQGWAVAYRAYLDGHPLADTYQLRETAAREKGRGLWGSEDGGGVAETGDGLITPLAIVLTSILTAWATHWFGQRRDRKNAQRDQENMALMLSQEIQSARERADVIAWQLDMWLDAGQALGRGRLAASLESPTIWPAVVQQAIHIPPTCLPALVRFYRTLNAAIAHMDDDGGDDDFERSCCDTINMVRAVSKDAKLGQDVLRKTFPGARWNDLQAARETVLASAVYQRRRPRNEGV